MYVLRTTVNVVYRCNCYVPVCSVLPFAFIPLCVAYATVSVLCILQYFFVFIVHFCVVPLTSVPPTTYPHTTHVPQLVLPPQWVDYS